MGLKDEILARVDLVELIGQYVALSPAGREWKGRCPFHEEKSASFHVNPEKGLFHCFGCKAGGSVINFVERMENLEFRDALEWLARRYNIDTSRYETGAQSAPAGEKERLYRINEAALKFFRDKLRSHEGELARAYLEKRGVPERITQDFDLGYAPREWQALTDFLLSHGASAKEVEKLGLIKARGSEQAGGSGGYYDSFRHRLIFPIRSVTGQVIGFAGRALSAEDNPKYLNVTNTPLYNKSGVLYNLDRAKGRMRDEGAVVVEGYMDVIGLASVGIDNAVASCGTALTAEHVKLLARYSESFRLAFDGDEAGRRAAWSAGVLFLAAGHNARVVPLPAGIDPDELVKERGIEAWRGLLAESKSVVGFWLEHQRTAQPNADIAEKRRWITQLGRLYAQLSDPLVRDMLVQESSGALGLGASEVAGLLRHSGGQGPAETRERGGLTARASITQKARERALLQGASPTEREVVRRMAADEQFRLVYTIEDNSELFADHTLREIYREFLSGKPLDELLYSERYSAVFAELLSSEVNIDDNEHLLRRHRNYYLQRCIDAKLAELQRASQAGDMEREGELMREILELKSQIREVRSIGGYSK